MPEGTMSRRRRPPHIQVTAASRVSHKCPVQTPALEGEATMANQQTSCVHRGNTFFGAVEVVAGGSDSLVRVRYNGSIREALLDGLTVDVAAHILLRELVLIEFDQAAERPVQPERSGGRAA